MLACLPSPVATADDLHAAIAGGCIQQRDPGRHLQHLPALRVQVAIVLQRGMCHSYALAILPRPAKALRHCLLRLSAKLNAGDSSWLGPSSQSEAGHHLKCFKSKALRSFAVPDAMGLWPAPAAVSWPADSTQDDLQCHLHIEMFVCDKQMSLMITSAIRFKPL